ncbi:MAG TPA: hypothetical protein VF625_06810, partial [Longimicrobium sp.]
VVPTPCASATPSWNSRSGRWHVAQATLPLPLSRVSKNSRCPSAAAALSSALRLFGRRRMAWFVAGVAGGLLLLALR